MGKIAYKAIINSLSTVDDCAITVHASNDVDYVAISFQLNGFSNGLCIDLEDWRKMNEYVEEFHKRKN
jgi:hypothetical protein